MGFTILRKNMIIEAVEVNNNFYHAARGDYIPRDGDSLSASTNDYDLGSSTYKYNNLYAKTIDGQMGVMRRIATYNIQTSGSSSIEFTGLNFHLYDTIQLVFYGLSPNMDANKPLNLLLNNDTSSSYRSITNLYGYLYGIAGETSSTWMTTTNGFPLLLRKNNYTTSPTEQAFAKILIKNKIGYKRFIFCENGQGLTTFTCHFEKSFGSWNNITDTLTSIKLFFIAYSSGAIFASNTMIDIWVS